MEAVPRGSQRPFGKQMALGPLGRIFAQVIVVAGSAVGRAVAQVRRMFYYRDESKFK